MSILQIIALILGIGIIFYILILAIILFTIYKLIKKHPIPAAFLLIILIVIGVMGTIDPLTIIPGIITLLSRITILIVKYRELKEVITTNQLRTQCKASGGKWVTDKCVKP